ncbi:MAG: hypothetical protein HY553_19365 [Elusimicrobia bacterium]|nr:hypothetical protein [Elusimicrobiota bacterium]
MAIPELPFALGRGKGRSVGSNGLPRKRDYCVAVAAVAAAFAAGLIRFHPRPTPARPVSWFPHLAVPAEPDSPSPTDRSYVRAPSALRDGLSSAARPGGRGRPPDKASAPEFVHDFRNAAEPAPVWEAGGRDSEAPAAELPAEAWRGARRVASPAKSDRQPLLHAASTESAAPEEAERVRGRQAPGAAARAKADGAAGTSRSAVLDARPRTAGGGRRSGPPALGIGVAGATWEDGAIVGLAPVPGPQIPGSTGAGPNEAGAGSKNASVGPGGGAESNRRSRIIGSGSGRAPASHGGGLGLSPASLEFRTGLGVKPPAQTVSVSNMNGGRLHWSQLDADRKWLSVAPGPREEELTVSVDSAGLAEGRYSGHVGAKGTVIAAWGLAELAQAVPVALTVGPPTGKPTPPASAGCRWTTTDAVIGPCMGPGCDNPPCSLENAGAQGNGGGGRWTCTCPSH